VVCVGCGVGFRVVGVWGGGGGGGRGTVNGVHGILYYGGRRIHK
jgi:hypothetical protein